MVRFDDEMVPAWLEVLKAKNAADAKDAELRLTLLDIIARARTTSGRYRTCGTCRRRRCIPPR